MNTCCRSSLVVAVFWLLAVVSVVADDVTSHSQAHAHNDYRHPHPLHDALAQGFCSVEADVFLVDGQLLVGHDRSELTPERTLQRLYLDPLQQRIRELGGHVYDNDVAFRLLVDIKSDATSTYDALDDVLATYGEMLVRLEEGRSWPGPVQVVISGNRDQQRIAADESRYAGIDGRLSDLGSDMPPDLLPWISDRWTAHFTWRGVGEMPENERKKLQRIVAQAHREGREVRFWATPDRPEIWQELVAAKVDLINTDDLVGLAKFLSQSQQN